MPIHEQIYLEMLKYDIVVTTPHFLAVSDDPSLLEMTFPRLDHLRQKRLANRGAALFDLIVFDEAQHSPAATWRAIRSALAEKSTKVLFTTAARYRSDRQPLDYDCATREFSWVDGLLAQPDPCIKDLCFLELKGGSVGACYLFCLFTAATASHGRP